MEEMFELEQTILNKAVEEKLKVRVVIVNGYKMVCTIEDFDSNVILCRCGGERKMVYRHAVSTIELD